jgi:flagellar hook-length control protein FliK
MPRLNIAPSEEAPALRRAGDVQAGVRMANALGVESRPTVESGVLSPATTADGSTLSPTLTGRTVPTLDAAGSSSHAPTLSPPAPESDPATSRLIRSLHTMLSHRGGAMTMRLDPPELGSVRIQMIIINGAVSAMFEADTDRGQSLLRQNLASLRTSLEQQGLHVDRLHVQTSGSQDSGQQQSNSRFDGQRERHERFGDASQGESRGRRDHSERGQHQRGNAWREAFAPAYHSATTSGTLQGSAS